jgi:hypothetical protein
MSGSPQFIIQNIINYPMAVGFFKSLIQKFTGRPVDWDELEEALIRSDLGMPMTQRILKELQAREEPMTAESVVKVAREEILKVLPRDTLALRPLASKTKVILVVGVNGTGKTVHRRSLPSQEQRPASCSPPPTPSAPPPSSNQRFK